MSEPFPHSSVGKESTCNAGDPSSIPRSGRSPGEGIGYPLQYSWVFLVAQLVKNPPAMWETWVQSLSWEDLLEKGKATHSSILAWRILWTTVHGVTETDKAEQLSLHFTSLQKSYISQNQHASIYLIVYGSVYLKFYNLFLISCLLNAQNSYLKDIPPGITNYDKQECKAHLKYIQNSSESMPDFKYGK